MRMQKGEISKVKFIYKWIKKKRKKRKKRKKLNYLILDHVIYNVINYKKINKIKIKIKIIIIIKIKIKKWLWQLSIEIL